MARNEKHVVCMRA